MRWVSRVRSIVAFRPAGLGDFIMSTPALVQVRAQFPSAHVTLLTMHSQSPDQAAKVEAYAGGQRAAPWTELVRPHLIDDVRVLPPVRNLASWGEARRAIARVRPDLIIQMFDPGTPYIRRAKKMAFMAALFGPVRQIGWCQPGQINNACPPSVDPQLGHHVHGPLQFLRELEGRRVPTDADVAFDLRPGAVAEAWARQWIAETGLGGLRLVAVAPGAVHDHKQWPLEKFVDLIQALRSRRPDLAFLIMGTANEQALADRLTALDPARVRSLCGVSSIVQSAALFRHCALVVGNDGGAMHLADAMGAPVVSLVPGLEFPVSIEPWHNQHRAVRLPVGCAPCYGFTFCAKGHRRCMIDLPLEAVIAQCERVV